MPKIFCPLSLTFRVAVTFGLRLELKYLELDAFSEILLPCYLCKLLKPHTALHAIVLQDSCSYIFG